MIKTVLVPEDKTKPKSQLILSSMVLMIWPVISLFLKDYSSDGLVIAIANIDMNTVLAFLSAFGAYVLRMIEKVKK